MRKAGTFITPPSHGHAVSACGNAMPTLSKKLTT